MTAAESPSNAATESAQKGDAARKPDTAGKPSTARKPRFAIFIATACGLGYIPLAPGTFGSLAGLLLAMLPWWILEGIVSAFVFFEIHDPGLGFGEFTVDVAQFHYVQELVTILIALIGVWTAGLAARFWQTKDPQWIVIDEVSGQHLTIFLGCLIPIWWRVPRFLEVPGHQDVALSLVLNWKYLLLGFILFRLFDIWKPFPVRQAESLPGGWGIMADDWVAAIYAAIGLWIARIAGL
jgi:phosphatidylglycerophosphatase A